MYEAQWIAMYATQQPCSEPVCERLSSDPVQNEQDACVAAALAWLELHAPEYYLPRATRSLEIAIRHKGKVAT